MSPTDHDITLRQTDENLRGGRVLRRDHFLLLVSSHCTEIHILWDLPFSVVVDCVGPA